MLLAAKRVSRWSTRTLAGCGEGGKCKNLCVDYFSAIEQGRFGALLFDCDGTLAETADLLLGPANPRRLLAGRGRHRRLRPEPSGDRAPRRSLSTSCPVTSAGLNARTCSMGPG